MAGTSKFITPCTERLDETHVSGVGLTIYIRRNLLKPIYESARNPEKYGQFVVVIH